VTCAVAGDVTSDVLLGGALGAVSGAVRALLGASCRRYWGLQALLGASRRRCWGPAVGAVMGELYSLSGALRVLLVDSARA
jgi:hypothetical protein